MFDFFFPLSQMSVDNQKISKNRFRFVRPWSFIIAPIEKIAAQNDFFFVFRQRKFQKSDDPRNLWLKQFFKRTIVLDTSPRHPGRFNDFHEIETPMFGINIERRSASNIKRAERSERGSVEGRQGWGETQGKHQQVLTKHPDALSKPRNWIWTLNEFECSANFYYASHDLKMIRLINSFR